MEPRYNETIFFTPVIAKCTETYLDVTKPSYSEQFLPVPWFCYLRLYFGIAIFVSRRFLLWITRIENGLKLGQQQDTGHTTTR